MNIYITNYRTAHTKDECLLADIDIPQKVHWFADTYKNAASELVHPTHRLIDKVVDEQLLNSLKSTKQGKTAFICAAGNAGFSCINFSSSTLAGKYKLSPLNIVQIYASKIAQACGATDLITTDATSCISSIKVLGDVINLITFYGFSRVVVLSADNPITDPFLNFFGGTNASLTYEVENKQSLKPSAFDTINSNFYLGQGASFVVFEAENATTNTPLLQLISAYSSSEENTNAISQREDGQGYIKAIEGALFYGSKKAEEIKTVKTHGTGTKVNNIAEKTALDSVLKEFVATSYKPSIGHTMSASGLLETLLMFEDIKSGTIPAIKNRTEDDTVFLSKSVSAPEGLCLSLTAGMGNTYSAAIFNMGV